jgi:hypothetical protein
VINIPFLAIFDALGSKKLNIEELKTVLHKCIYRPMLKPNSFFFNPRTRKKILELPNLFLSAKFSNTHLQKNFRTIELNFSDSIA